MPRLVKISLLPIFHLQEIADDGISGTTLDEVLHRSQKLFASFSTELA